MKKTILMFLSIILLISLPSCNKMEIDFDEILENRPQIIDEEKTPIYTISFQTNGGTKVEPIERNTLSFSPLTTKEGYNFAGWYLDSALTQEASFPITITENIVLYAKWDIQKYTVTFKSNGGTPIGNMTTDVIQSAPNIEKDGYAFEGWYTDKELTKKAIFPIYLKSNTTLYAKWLQKKYTTTINEFKIKDTKKYSSYQYINITPKDLDIEELAKQGYKITITVSFDVNYKKDYDVLFDIGYFGAPEYEIYLEKDSTIVQSKEKIKATSSKTHKTISYTDSVINIKNNKIYFKASTDNIQNIIYFSNIVVTYECTK